MSKGNRTKGPRKGRPPLAKGEARERINVRVAPRTLLWLDRMAEHCGGVGGAIDHACDVARETGHALDGNMERKLRG